MKKNYYIIGIGGFLFGYITTVISGALLFITKEFHATTSAEGMIVSSIMVGAIVGSLICTSLSDRFGRKKVCTLLATLFLLGILVSSLATSLTIFIFGRLVVGLAIGGVSGITPIYLSELAPTAKRGAITSINTLFNAIGILIAYVVNNIFFNSGNWRAMFLVALLPIIIYLIGSFIVLESPIWLIRQEEYTKAAEIAHQIYGVDYSEEAIPPEESSFQKEARKKSWQSWMFRPLLISIFLIVVQQICGSTSVMYYAPKILVSSGFGESAATISSIGIGVVVLIFVLICQKIVDQIGRKKLLIYGSSAMFVTLIISALFVKLEVSPILIFVTLLLFMASYSISWSTVPWIILGEVVPSEIRGVGTGICTAFMWTSLAAISFFFPLLLDWLGIVLIFVLFALINVISLVIVKFFVFETKGKTLEEIEFKFRQARNRQLKEDTKK